MWKNLFCFFSLVCLVPAFAQDTPFIPITADNISQLELGYAVPGGCFFNGFSPDNTLLAVGYNGVFDVATGQKQFSFDAYTSYFSPDGMTLISDDGIYDVKTGQRIKENEGGNNIYIADGTLALVVDGVYNTQNWAKRFSINGGAGGEFSIDNSIVIVNGDGVYDVITGRKFIDIDNVGYGEFSSDNRWFGVKTGWSSSTRDHSVFIYDTYTRKLVFSDYAYGFTFSPDSKLIAITDLGVYEIATGKQLYNIPGFDFTFSDDSLLIIAWNDGVYDLITGKKLFPIKGLFGYFSPTKRFVLTETNTYEMPTGKLVAGGHGIAAFLEDDRYLIKQGGIFDTNTWQFVVTATQYGRLPSINDAQTLIRYDHSTYHVEPDTGGTSCLLYGIRGSKWAYRSGVVQADSPINFYDVPDGQVLGQLVSEMIVYAQTSDKQYFKTIYRTEDYHNLYAWIRAEDVTPAFIPEGIPFENP